MPHTTQPTHQPIIRDRYTLEAASFAFNYGSNRFLFMLHQDEEGVVLPYEAIPQLIQDLQTIYEDTTCNEPNGV